MLVTFPSIISVVDVNKERERHGTKWRGFVTKTGDFDFNDFKESLSLSLFPRKSPQNRIYVIFK